MNLSVSMGHQGATTGMTSSQEKQQDPLVEEAIDWLLRLKDNPCDTEASRQFEAWCASSPAHARAWEKAVKVWQLMGEVLPVHAKVWAGPAVAAQAHVSASQPRRISSGHKTAQARRDGVRPTRGWKKRLAGGCAIAAVGLFAFIAGPDLLLRLEADHMTRTGESRVVQLDDGSTITLGADSAIAAHMEGPVRRITLLSGEALFDVAHDPNRPFEVDAGGVAVRVLGTVFDVRLSSTGTMVELARGAVSVTSDTGSSDTRLTPGETALVNRRTGAVEMGQISPQDIATWREGRLFVNDAPIGAVVEQLQRYHPAWIRVMDSSLADERVTGLYDLSDPDRALRALVQPYGGQVRTISPYLRLLTRE